MAERGFRVFAGCLKKGGEGEQRLRAAAVHGKLTTLQLDVTKENEIEKAVDFIRQETGDSKLETFTSRSSLTHMKNFANNAISMKKMDWKFSCHLGSSQVNPFSNISQIALHLKNNGQSCGLTRSHLEDTKGLTHIEIVYMQYFETYLTENCISC